MSLRQSFSWWCVNNRGLTPDEILKTAKDIGYEGVDLIEESLWPLVKKHGLKLAAVDGHGSIGEGLNRRENTSRIEAELRTKIAKAEQWSVPVLICFSGERRGQADAEGLKICAETLHRIAPIAANSGVTLAVELLNSKVDHADYQADHTAWGVELCRLVDSPAVRLLYDIYHMQIMEGDIIRTIQADHEFFAHYHTAGNPGRGQPDETQELYYPAIYHAIESTGYRGFVAHEFVPALPVPEALKRAFQDCEKASAKK